MEVWKEDDEYLWVRCLNPKHDDHNPSLCINKIDKGKYKKGYAYCFSCGYSTQFTEEAVDKISNKKTRCRLQVPIDWKSLSDSFRAENNLDVCKQFAKKIGVSSNIVKLFEIGWDGDAYTIPMFNEEEKYVGIQRQFPDGSKFSVYGSQLGLFLPDQNIDECFVLICEGLSDTIVATELGYCSIGKPSAIYGDQIIRKFLELWHFEGEITIVQDNDSAGDKSTAMLKSALKSWNVRVVIPDTDLRQYYLDNGTKETVKLINS